MAYEIYVVAFFGWRESVLQGRSLGICFYLAQGGYTYMAKALACTYLNSLKSIKIWRPTASIVIKTPKVNYSAGVFVTGPYIYSEITYLEFLTTQNCLYINRGSYELQHGSPSHIGLSEP